MRRFIDLDAIAAPLPQDNVDTDKILPGEYLKTVTRVGLGCALFARMRYVHDGSENPAFILNREPWRNAGILVAGHNFGCGSSREHAPWAFADFGIAAIIAKSFADIFYNNCFKNGILPITLVPKDHELIQRFAENPKTARLKISLPHQQIEIGNSDSIFFSIDAGRKAALMEGRDEVAETLSLETRIEQWRSENAGHTVAPAISMAKD